MSQGDLDGLTGAFADKVRNVLTCLQGKGWRPRVASGLRSREEQAEKVRLGYSQTMDSRHLTGNAADIIDRGLAWTIGKDHQYWKDLSTCAKAEDLTWGGDWSMADVAHVELK